MPTVTVIIPTYNEEKAITSTVKDVKGALLESGWEAEIIVVDDHSKDKTPEMLKAFSDITVLRNPLNMGYSASIKRGMRAAKGEYIIITDADGTYPNKDIPRLLKLAPSYDMVVGVRDQSGDPLLRKPAKWMLFKLANFLSEMKIPDLNSGFRIFRKDRAEEFYHLYPNRFSFTSTITLAFMTSGYMVKYIPIEYYKRIGASKMKPKDFIMFVSLISRIVMYFKPLKFFATPSILLVLVGLLWGAYQIINNPATGIGQLPIILILGGLQFLFLGLIADLVVKRK